MQYLISFLEGIITFISPCLLPMLPVYLSYFAGGGEQGTRRTLANAAGFVLGFTCIFVAMGALAGTVGGPANMKDLYAMGYRLINLGSDVGTLGKAFTGIMAQVTEWREADKV